LAISADHFLKLTKGAKLRPLDDVLQDVLLHAVTYCGGNKTQAADALEISRATLYRKLGVLGELLSETRKQKVTGMAEQSGLPVVKPARRGVSSA
jgi:DNA-binding NtrC family response regulator